MSSWFSFHFYLQILIPQSSSFPQRINSNCFLHLSPCHILFEVLSFSYKLPRSKSIRLWSSHRQSHFYSKSCSVISSFIFIFGHVLLKDLYILNHIEWLLIPLIFICTFLWVGLLFPVNHFQSLTIYSLNFIFLKCYCYETPSTTSAIPSSKLSFSFKSPSIISFFIFIFNHILPKALYFSPNLIQLLFPSSKLIPTFL